jgi:hypothetical protein
MMAVTKETHWGTAFAAAAKHPDGELVNVHGSTLRAMETAGAAHRRNGKWYMTRKGPGPVEEPKIEKPEEAESPKRASIGMDPEMRSAFERAVHTTTGYFYGASEAVLARLVDMGIAYQDVDEEAHQLTEKGWELGTVPDPVSPKGVKYRVADTARWEIPIELVDPVPDTQAPGFGMVRPKSVTITLTTNRAGVWAVSSVAVWGPKVKDGKVTTKREYSTLFSDLMNEVTETPEWLRGICQEWADRANGWGVTAPPKKSEMPLEERQPRKEKSPQRAAFDSALRVLLIRENLDGTEWALRWFREEADRLPDENVGNIVKALAVHCSADLDKRTAELATREH